VSTAGDVSALLAFAESMASALEECSKDQAKIIQQAQTDPAVRSRLTHHAIQASAASMHTNPSSMDSARHRKRHASHGTVALSSRSSALLGLRVYDETLLCHSGTENAARRRGSSVSGRYDAWQCHFASFITGPFQETFLRRKRPLDVCVILRAGTSVGDSAENSHFEARDRLPPTDDDDDSDDVTPH